MKEMKKNPLLNNILKVLNKFLEALVSLPTPGPEI